MKIKIYSGWDRIASLTVDPENCTGTHTAYKESEDMEIVRNLSLCGFNVIEDGSYYHDGKPMGYNIKEPLIINADSMEKILIQLSELFKCDISVNYKDECTIMILMFGGNEYLDN